MLLKKSNRDLTLDSIKGILIVFVVFGHLIEESSFYPSKLIYQIIYVVHMPLFVMVAGINRGIARQKININIIRYFWLFLVWEFLYQLFIYFLDGRFILGTTPFWILWFLLSLIFWNFIPFINNKNAISLLALIFFISLASILFKNIGYPFSAQRTLYFSFFFVFGMYLKQNYLVSIANLLSGKFGLIFILGILLVILYLTSTQIPRGLLYGSFSASALGLSPLSAFKMRAMLIFSSTMLSLVVIYTFYKWRMVFFNSFGKNSIVIYLTHGFFVLIFRKFDLIYIDSFADLLCVLVFSIILCSLLGSNWLFLKLKRISLI